MAGDVDSIVYNALSADMEGLPQSEPMFDVREATVTTDEALSGVLKYARSLLLVDVNPKKYSSVCLGVKHNVYADPQVIVVLCAPSASALREEVSGGRLGGFSANVIDSIRSHETAISIADLRRKHNPKMEAEVKRMFGFDMLIPPDMTSFKCGKDFLWISNDSPTAMLNICVYGSNFSKRDSVMRVNIKGETDSMYMTTVHESCRVKYACEGTGWLSWHDWHGLWEMKGDAMGGPLVARTIWGLRQHTPVTVEGFVYAPGQKKRNLVMRLEAVLRTVGKTGHGVGSQHDAMAHKNKNGKPVHVD